MVFTCAATGSADDADRVCLIDQETAAVCGRHVRDLAQRRDRAVHAEYPIEAHRERGAQRESFNAPPKTFHIIVTEGNNGYPSTFRAVPLADVRMTVENDSIMWREERRQHCSISSEATVEYCRGLLSVEIGKLFLELQVQTQGPVEEPRARRAGTVAAGGFLCRLDHRAVRAEPEIVT